MWLPDCRPSRAKLRVADQSTIQLQLQGLARLHTYDDRGRPVCIRIPDAVSDSRLTNLLSLGRAQRRLLKVVTDTDTPHVLLQSGRRIPLRRSGDLLYLDFLVPTSPSRNVDTAVHADFVASERPTYVIDICAGTSSSLQYHAHDPLAKLMAIDILEP